MPDTTSWIRSPTEAPARWVPPAVSRLLGGHLFVDELHVHPQHEEGTEDRQDPAGRLELAVRRFPDHAADAAADDRAHDAENARHDPAHALRTRHDPACDGADDQADDDGPN